MAALALALASAAQAAQASVTSSRITSPSGPISTLNDTTLSSSPVAFTVQGTFSGSTHTQLAINCYDGSGNHQTVAENVEGSAGFFSVVISSSALLGGTPCVLRAVPLEDYEAYPPGSESQFQGPTVAPSELYVSTFSGTAFDYDFTAATLGASHEFSSVGDCGLGSSEVYLASSLTAEATAFDCDATLYAEEPLEDQPSPQSEIQIDGINAYGPYAAQHLRGAVPGAPSLTIAREFDPSTGLMTIHETDPIVICSPDPALFPPTASSCSSFVSAGVSLLRTWHTEESGAVVSLTDSWSSTDGAAHSLVALYDNRLQSAGASAAGFLFPGSASFSDFRDESTVTLPSGPGSIFYTQDRSAPVDGHQEHPFAAISYDTPPDGAVAFTHSDLEGAHESSFVMPYRRTIPAGGAFTLRMSFAQALALSEAQGHAHEVVAAYSPTLSISEPVNGATVSTPTTTVAGEASYAHTISALTVNGAPVQLGSNGAWSAPVTLSPGTNTITVTATGEEGLATSQSVAVTYLPPASLPGTPPIIETPPLPETPALPETPPVTETPVTELPGTPPATETPIIETPAPAETPVIETPTPPETPPIAETPPTSELPATPPVTEPPEIPLGIEPLGAPKTPPTIEAAVAPSGESRLRSDPLASPSIIMPDAAPAISVASPATASVVGPIRAAQREVSFMLACVGSNESVCDIVSSVDATITSRRSGGQMILHAHPGLATTVPLGSASYSVEAGQTRKIMMNVDTARVDDHDGSGLPVDLTVTMMVGGKQRTVAVRRLTMMAQRLKR